MYGHVGKLAEEIHKGANSVEGVEATLYQVCSNFSISPLEIRCPLCGRRWFSWLLAFDPHIPRLDWG